MKSDYNNTKTLNIPYALIWEYRNDKQKRDLLAFAVCLKMLYGSSAFHPSVSLVRSLMNCRSEKAQRLLEQAKNCPELFYYNEKKNFLVAKNLVRPYIIEQWVEIGKDRILSKSAYCHKFEYDPNERVSHYDVANKIFNVIILCGIAQFVREDNFIKVGDVTTQSSTCPDRKKAITQRRMAKTLNCHHSTISRRIKKLEAKGIISVNRYPIVMIMHTQSGTRYKSDNNFYNRRAFCIGAFAYVREANEYNLGTNWNFKCCNVIFNHKDRLRHNVSKSDAWYQCFM